MSWVNSISYIITTQKNSYDILQKSVGNTQCKSKKTNVKNHQCENSSGDVRVYHSSHSSSFSCNIKGNIQLQMSTNVTDVMIEKENVHSI